MFETVSVGQVREGQIIRWGMQDWMVQKAEPNMLGQMDIYLIAPGEPGRPKHAHLIFNEDEFKNELWLIS
jgi:hypothetical protein